MRSLSMSLLPAFGLVWVLTLAPFVQAGHISGKVTNVCDTGSEGVAVHVVDSAGKVSVLITDRFGSYSANHLADGTYWITLEKDHRPRILVPEGGVYRVEIAGSSYTYTGLDFTGRVGGAQVDFGTHRTTKPKKNHFPSSTVLVRDNAQSQVNHHLAIIKPREDSFGVAFDLVFLFEDYDNSLHRGWAVTGSWETMSEPGSEIVIQDAIETPNQPAVFYSDALPYSYPCVAKMATNVEPVEGDFAVVTFYMERQVYEALVGQVIKFRYNATTLLHPGNFGETYAQSWMGLLGSIQD